MARLLSEGPSNATGRGVCPKGPGANRRLRAYPLRIMIQPALNLYIPTVDAGNDPPRSQASALARVERGGWIAVALCAIAVVLLRQPFRGQTLDEAGLYAINHWMSGFPFIDLQTAILNQDVTQLVMAMAMAMVAVWFRMPVDTRLRTRILIAVTACFPTYAIARLAQHLAACHDRWSITH